MAKTYTPFVNGNTLPAATLNTQLLQQAVIQAQTTDRPGSPQVGMTIIETDYSTAVAATGLWPGLKQYASATTTWVPPWNMPFGHVGSALVTSGVSNIASATYADCTGMSVTFTAIANRRYRITTHSVVQLTGAASACNQQILVGATRYAVNYSTMVSSDYATLGIHAVVTGLSSGSVTAKLQWNSTSATTIVPVYAADAPWSIVVEDIGPSGAPA